MCASWLTRQGMQPCKTVRVHLHAVLIVCNACGHVSAHAMGISKYVFFSIYDCHKHPEVPLMNIKACTEKFLESSGLNFTTFRLCGFHQVSHLS